MEMEQMMARLLVKMKAEIRNNQEEMRTNQTKTEASQDRHQSKGNKGWNKKQSRKDGSQDRGL
jgi:hypothetical protein